MWKPLLSAALLTCFACGHAESGDERSTADVPNGEPANGTAGSEDASGSDGKQPPASLAEPEPRTQAQTLNAIFRLHAEFGGCGIKQERQTEDLSEFGIRKPDLAALFGTKQVNARDGAGQSQNLSFDLSWTDSTTLAVETVTLPSDDDFGPNCPGKTVALPVRISLSSAETGALSGSGYLFTTDSSKASGTLQARSAAGKDHILTINVTATGTTTGNISEVTLMQASGSSSRQTKTVLEW